MVDWRAIGSKVLSAFDDHSNDPFPSGPAETEFEARIRRSLQPGLGVLQRPPSVGLPYADINGPRDTRTHLDAYRADPRNRSGGKDGLETMPTKLDTWELHDIARGMAAARVFGIPQLSAQDLAAFALKEGRSDFGSNGDLYDNPASNYGGLRDVLVRSGLSTRTATILTQIKEKHDVATRLNIPFAQAWNGTGQAWVNDPKTNRPRAGATGEQYAQDYENYRRAAVAPRNKRLMQVIQTGITKGLEMPLQANTLAPPSANAMTR